MASVRPRPEQYRVATSLLRAAPSSAVRYEIAVETCENGSHEKERRDVVQEERGQHGEPAWCGFAADPVVLFLLFRRIKLLPRCPRFE